MLELIKEQLQAANPILGAIEFEIITDLTKMPQGYASAWSKLNEQTGASYNFICTVGKQVAKGTNYWFMVKLTTITKIPEEHLVTMAANEFEGNFTPVNGSIVRIF